MMRDIKRLGLNMKRWPNRRKSYGEKEEMVVACEVTLWFFF